MTTLDKNCLVPENVYSFQQLDQANAIKDLQSQYYRLLLTFTELSQNIINAAAYGYNPMDSADSMDFDFNNGLGYDPSFVVELLSNLIDDFKVRLDELQAPKTLLKAATSGLGKGDSVYWAFLDDKGKVTDKGVGKISDVKTSGKYDNYEATTSNPVYVIKQYKVNADGTYSSTSTTSYKRAGQVRKVKKDVVMKKEQDDEALTKEIYSSDSLTLYKAADGTLEWYGVYSNTQQDRDGHTITLESHLNFVDMVNKGLAPYPELWIWHLPKAVGETNFLGVSEEGFAVAGGIVYKEYADLVSNLVSNTPDIRMSHGMPLKYIQMTPSKVITSHITKELSFLPGDKASNLLTTFIME